VTAAGMAVASAVESGVYSTRTAAELLRLIDVFADLGEPAVLSSRTAGHLTWRAGRAVLTISVGECGHWGFFLSSPGDANWCDVGRRDDADSVARFRECCLMGKAVAVGFLNAAGGGDDPPRTKRKRRG
jgi:hypothetical protein